MRMDEDGRMELVLAESADFNASYDMLRIKIAIKPFFMMVIRCAEDARACLNEVIRQVTGDAAALESPASLLMKSFSRLNQKVSLLKRCHKIRNRRKSNRKKRMILNRDG